MSVDLSSINRWAVRFLPLIEKMARRHKRPVGASWRMDETYIKVKGVWNYLYRAVDKTADFLLTATRDMAAAKRFFDKAMKANGDPDKVAMDKSGANKAALDAINAGPALPILLRHIKYLNNIVEQDHRAIKRVTRPMLNFKSFRAAGSVLAGIEMIHMIRKGQFAIDGADAMSLADQFLGWQGWSVALDKDSALPGRFRLSFNNSTEPSAETNLTESPSSERYFAEVSSVLMNRMSNVYAGG